MILKLIKHEIKNQWAYLVGVFLIIGVMLIGQRMMFIPLQQDSNVYLGFLSVSFGLTIFSLLCAVSFIVVSRFYKSMYGDEGYLTHTLPISMHAILLVKIFVGLVYIALSLILVGIVSMTFIPDLSVVLDHINEIFRVLFKEYPLLPFILIFSSIANLTRIYFAMAISQLFNGKRVIITMIAYVIISIATLFITTILFQDVLTGFTSIMLYASHINNNAMLYALITNIAICTVHYLGIYFISTRKINLQ